MRATARTARARTQATRIGSMMMRTSDLRPDIHEQKANRAPAHSARGSVRCGMKRIGIHPGVPGAEDAVDGHLLLEAFERKFSERLGLEASHGAVECVLRDHQLTGF